MGRDHPHSQALAPLGARTIAEASSSAKCTAPIAKSRMTLIRNGDEVLLIDRENALKIWRLAGSIDQLTSVNCTPYYITKTSAYLP